jgi:hypothetical protein
MAGIPNAPALNFPHLINRACDGNCSGVMSHLSAKNYLLSAAWQKDMGTGRMSRVKGLRCPGENFPRRPQANLLIWLGSIKAPIARNPPFIERSEGLRLQLAHTAVSICRSSPRRRGPSALAKDQMPAFAGLSGNIGIAHLLTIILPAVIPIVAFASQAPVSSGDRKKQRPARRQCAPWPIRAKARFGQRWSAGRRSARAAGLASLLSCGARVPGRGSHPRPRRRAAGPIARASPKGAVAQRPGASRRSIPHFGETKNRDTGHPGPGKQQGRRSVG